MNRNLMLLLLLLATLASLIILPMIGTIPIPLQAVLDPTGSWMESALFWQVRIPRVLASFLSGSALAISGLTFQAIFRTPLATPFTLGVSSGASLGAVLYIQMGLSFALLGIPGIAVAAFTGAILTIILVYSLARYHRLASVQTILLAGVAVNFFCSSLILLLQYLSDFTQSFRIVHWLMGGVEGADFQSVLGIFPFVILGSGIIFYLSRDLNLIRTGDDIAISRGVNLKRAYQLFFGVTSLMVGIVVSNWGPIGFIGIIVPYICRLLIGSDHRFLGPASFLFGGVFLTVCDTVARTLIAPAEIPVGVITALLGGPFFLWLLIGTGLTRSKAF